MTALVAGLRIGHATDLRARTGCTVLLGPFRGAVCVPGMATATRELETLSAQHLAPRADAVLLTGGSAFGLASADGVVAWLEAHGQGFRTGGAIVPIVPAAGLYDLGVGRAERRPDAAMGRAAAEAALTAMPAEGAVGAGTGATVGKLLGAESAAPGGFGCFTHTAGGITVTAAVAVNALGDVVDASGRIVAGARHADGSLADGARLLRERPAAAAAPHGPATNTTLAAVVTDAPFDRASLAALARMAATALPRRIRPVFTPLDGDVVFALGTAEDAGAPSAPVLLAAGEMATWALEQAIERAVRAAAAAA
jgi:L-aminopeptidase/D-esterase-like protein